MRKDTKSFYAIFLQLFCVAHCIMKTPKNAVKVELSPLKIKRKEQKALKKKDTAQLKRQLCGRNLLPFFNEVGSTGGKSLNKNHG